MNKKQIILLGALTALIFFGWRIYYNDERQIKSIVKKIEETLSSSPEVKAFPAVLKKAKKTGKHFYPTTSLKFESNRGVFTIQSRSELEGHLISFFKQNYRLKETKKTHLSLKIENSKKAVMELDFEIQDPQLKSISLPLKAEWIKEKGSWLIYKAGTRSPVQIP